MSAKVAAKHRLDDLLPSLQPLLEDPTARVVAAAERAVVRIIGSAD